MQEFKSKRPAKPHNPAKLLEKAGLSLKDTLWKADPWGGPPWPRANCKVCEYNKEEVICRSTNLVYANVCLICKDKGGDRRYIGETGRSLGQRAGEHWDQCVARDEGSHIWEHQTQ